MSVIGLDFGSHWASFAVYNAKSGACEVFADDLGSRAVPCVIAFRGVEEVIVGQAALAQQYKNSANTFANIRKQLEDGVETVHVPALSKDIPVIELASHFFRHIHNQVRDQVGQEVRDCVISIPASHLGNEAFRSSLAAAAQAGGIRIKSFIPDTTAAVLAHQLDTVPVSNFFEKKIIGSNCSKFSVVVIDLGWTKSEVALFEVLGGLISPLHSRVSTECNGATVVHALTNHCTKDFKRKTKVSCDDNQRSLLRLQKETEAGVRILSTTQETVIDLDALVDGLDYSGKISRARFEDLACLYFMGVKNLVSSLEVEPGSVTHVILSGGFSAIPKTLATVKDLFPAANFLRGRVDPTEAVCLGAALHGMTLSKEGLLDDAPVTSATLAVLPVSLFLNEHIIFPQGLALPLATIIPVTATTKEDTGFVLSYEGGELAQVLVPTSQITSPDESVQLCVTLSVSLSGAVNVSVAETATHRVLVELDIPSSP